MEDNTTLNFESQQWYQDAKFGMFIHWGPYSVAGVEASWSMMAPDLAEAMFKTSTRITEMEYVALPARFNPVDFNADEWVRMAQDAGMRYIVMTAKHHDGFCMFDAPGTDYKITHTPFGRDICLELSQACARAGMPLGFYYSPPDLHHPGYRDTSKAATQNWTGEPKRKQWAAYLDYMESHIRKLLTDYGEVCVLWFDALADHAKYEPERFHTLIRELSPNTLINDRLGDDFDFVTPEQFIPKTGIPARTGKPPAGMSAGGDSFFRTVCSLFKVPVIRGWIRKQMEKYADGTLELTPVYQEPYPAPERFQPWETCMTMGQSWAYNPAESAWKSPTELLHNLVEVVSRGGNYLLNVGPTASGIFPPEAVERLAAIGRWMKTHHEAIYGCTYTPLQGQTWCRATRKADKVYLHLFQVPDNGKLSMDTFPGQVHKAALMSGEPLAFSQQGRNLEIMVPSVASEPNVRVLVLDINPTEKGWFNYSAPVLSTIPIKKYIHSQVINNMVINALINGVIAYFSYRTRTGVPFAEAAVDILITVFIITFLVAWFGILAARTQFAKGNLTQEGIFRHRIKLPGGAGLRALSIAIACSIFLGGVGLDGSLFLLNVDGFSPWGYIVFKTLYAAAAAGLAAVIAIQSVAEDENRK